MGEVGAAFGLRFALPDYLVEIYKDLKNDLPAFKDDPGWTLPMPGRFVIRTGRHDPLCGGQSRTIPAAPRPEDMLPVLRQAAQSRAA